MKRPFFISRATWAMIQEARRTPNYSWFDFLHGYIYLRWPYFYIGVGTGEHPLAKAVAPVANWLIERLGKKPEEQTDAERTTFADTYHGKVMPLDDAKRLVTVQEEIRAPDLERVIPYTMARALILRHPEHIAVLDCPCRSARPDPCLPLDVCLIIGEPFAGLVREHHPERSRSITAEEAVAILQAEDERGHVHHAFFKDAMLGRFYAICNCCACCCGAMQAQRNGVQMLASSGYICQVDEAACVGCGTCAPFCQFEAIRMDDGDDGHAVIDAEACMGCGVCTSKCPRDALSLVRAPSRGEPLKIEHYAGA